MPRRNRRPAAGPVGPPRPLRTEAPDWARREGHEVRQVTGDKPYRCPGCDHPIRPGLVHLVVVPIGDPDGRRHWHEACWRAELRRTGLG